MIKQNRNLNCSGLFSFLALFVWLLTSPSISAIITNDNDPRTFEYLELENQLKVLLISDPHADNAAAALDVAVGSGEDPADRNGLAHLLEHMLFLGTEKYPRAGEFQEFVTGHGGDHNAYTSLMHTNYYFDINADYFEPALDRFSQFFITPLFSIDYVERERRVVHSEYTSKLGVESRRQKDVIRELVLPNHPLAKFSTGNVDTLSSVDAQQLRSDILKFYRQHYDAPSMSLVVMGPYELAQMKKWVKQSFSRIKNRSLPPPVTWPQLFAKDFLPAEVHIQPRNTTNKLSLIFPMPSSLEFEKQKPLQYISNFIEHGGEGSLLSVLKNAGWAVALRAGTNMRWRGGEAFGVHLYLTEAGFENIAEVYRLVFDYMDLLSRRGITRWRFDELASIGKLAFDYRELGDPLREVSYLASRLHDTVPENIFWGSYAWENFDRKLLASFLGHINRDNVLKILVAPTLEGNQTSQFYHTSYKVVEEKQSLLVTKNSGEYSNDLKDQLALPKTNNFLTKSVTVFDRHADTENAEIPQLIYQKAHTQGWYLNDNISDVPKGFIGARYLLPVVAQSAESFAALKLYTRIIRDSLNHVSYSASLAGLSYSLKPSSRGIDIEFYGYNSTLQKLSDRVLKALTKFNKSTAYRRKLVDFYFDDAKEELLRVQKNRKYERVYSQLFREIPAILYSPYWSSADLEGALKNLDKERFLSTASHFFDDGHLDTFVYGNFRKRDANRHIAKLSSLVVPRGKYPVPLGKVVNLSRSSPFVNALVVDSQDSASVLYVQGRNDSIEERAKLLILEKAMSSPFYQSLRTEKQLGYIVLSANYMLRDVPGLVAIIQSPRYGPEELYENMQQFFTLNKDKVLSRFERDRKAVIVKLQERPKNQIEWADRHWNSILNNDLTFDENARLIRAIEGISKKQVEILYNDILIENSVDIIFIASQDTIGSKGFHPSATLIENYKNFKSTMPSYFYP